MYSLPLPTPRDAAFSATDLAKLPGFVSQVEEVAARGGVILSVSAIQLHRAGVAMPAFWAAVEAELVGTPWKLEPSGLRDGGATRRLLPR